MEVTQPRNAIPMSVTEFAPRPILDDTLPPPPGGLQLAAAWVLLGRERMGLARGMDDGGRTTRPQDSNFTLTGSKAVSDVDISVPDLMALCLAENDRRFAGSDRRLLRPKTMPALTRLALRATRFGHLASASIPRLRNRCRYPVVPAANSSGSPPAQGVAEPKDGGLALPGRTARSPSRG